MKHMTGGGRVSLLTRIGYTVKIGLREAKKTSLKIRISESYI